MLILKKISTKKLAIYITIIFFMVSGTVFMLYQNKNLTSRKSVDINIPMVFDNSASTIPVAIFRDNVPGIVGGDNQAAAGSSQASDINKINQNSDFNLDIFSSDKFKMLKESAPIIKDQSEVGKRDLFKPN
ncbi:MAG: hypothetical protein V1801_02895 [Candidatus Falkowbacteria bacterium]